MTDALAAVLLLLGAALILISAVGMLRLPDVFMRLHAATKAGTLGAGLVLLAATVHFGMLAVSVKATVVFIFLLVTAPVAGHVLGRAAVLEGDKKWSRTHLDELEGRYDP
jgi:multicomponent Na+:H+ antiporter subunit G